MGIFEFLTGNSDPSPGPRLTRDELYQRLLALDDPQAGWHVRPAADEGGADLVAEMGPVDMGFRHIFGVTGKLLSKRVLLRLREEDAIVRSVDQDGTFSWKANVAELGFQAAGFRGQSHTVEKIWTFGGKEGGAPGQTETRTWDSDVVKRPLRQTVAEAGWGWHGVVFGDL